MPRRSTRWYRRNEEKVMRELGFSPTKNSGAGWVEKEDGESESCLCQLKSTDKQSLSVKLSDLKTLVENSCVAHKIPIFALQFIQTNDVWIMIRPQDLLDVQGVANGIKPKKNQKDFEISIDNEEEKEYNNTCNKVNIINSDTLKSTNIHVVKTSRENYYKKREQEIEKEQRKWKEQLKSKNRKRREGRKKEN